MNVFLAALCALICVQAAVDGVPMQAYYSTVPQSVHSQATQTQQTFSRTENRYLSVKNCYDVWERSNHTAPSGLYAVQPGIESGHIESFVVYCDMDNFPGGGWTIILQRMDGSGVKFNHPWGMYRNGFGDLQSNFWLGLEKMHLLTNSAAMELFVGLVSFKESQMAYARYGMFEVGAESNQYPLYINNYDQQSTAGDSLSSHHAQPFSTVDKENDDSTSYHCAEYYESGWWYKNCHDSNLNGKYYDMDADNDQYHGIIWSSWATHHESLKSAVMAIKPVHP